MQFPKSSDPGALSRAHQAASMWKEMNTFLPGAYFLCSCLISLASNGVVLTPSQSRQKGGKKKPQRADFTRNLKKENIGKHLDKQFYRSIKCAVLLFCSHLQCEFLSYFILVSYGQAYDPFLISSLKWSNILFLLWFHFSSVVIQNHLNLAEALIMKLHKDKVATNSIATPTNCQTLWKILIKSHRGKEYTKQWKTVKSQPFQQLSWTQIDTENPSKNRQVPGFLLFCFFFPHFVFHFPVKDKKNQEQRNVGLDNDILSIWKVMSIKTLWDVLNLFQTKIFIDWLPIRLSLLSVFLYRAVTGRFLMLNQSWKIL